MTKSIFKNILLTFSFVMCTGLWLMAQPTGEGPQRGQGAPVGHVEKMAQELGLSDEQKSQMQAINQEMGQKRREIGKNLTPEDRKAAMDKIKVEQDTKVKAILTPEQQTKFTEIQENRPRGGGRERKEAIKPEKLSEKLNLDETQNAEFKKITDETKASMKEIRNSTTLSPDEKKAALKKLEEEQEAKLKTVLNDEQYEKFLTEKGETKERIQEKMKEKKKAKKAKKKKKAKKAKKAKKEAETTEETK